MADGASILLEILRRSLVAAWCWRIIGRGGRGGCAEGVLRKGGNGTFVRGLNVGLGWSVPCFDKCKTNNQSNRDSDEETNWTHR
jgi:hypothetical protein